MKTFPSLMLGATFLAVAGCTRPDLPAPQGAWTMQASATAGAALILAENGSEALRIACRRNPADLLVTTSRLPGRGGQVALQIGDAAFALVADAGAPHLTAAGPISPALPAALVSGQPFVLRQGRAATAAVRASDAETAAAFAAACRRAAL